MTGSWRLGNGVDVHAFATDPDRPLVLGGVAIPTGPGLAGHSDADVVLHALVDGLLGAIAAGDIGTLFGVDDPAYAGADSAVFVREAVDRVGRAGFAVGNVDVTVIAARPRLAEHCAAMRETIAQLLGVARERVSVKATTTDGLGFTGRGEGMAALASVLLHETT